MTKDAECKEQPTGKLDPAPNLFKDRLDAGPSKPETIIEIVKVTVTFDQIKKFFRRIFRC